MTYWDVDEQWTYRGQIGRDHRTSTPWYPQRATASGPNVVLVLFDDLGFADLGCFGSEIRTPNIDAVASRGHRYNNFHTTTLCSPSRAALLTGRNHHSVGMRMLSNVDSGWPSGRGRITRRASLVPEVLRDEGYDTFAVGKWHIAPMRDVSPGGPFDEWPLGRGFNHFYGFMNGATDHFYPELVRDNQWIEPPGRPEDGYHLNDDMVEQSKTYISDHLAHRPDTPFFLYLPLGATHTPHHAPAEYMDAVRGDYDDGWDVIRRRRYERQLAEGIIPPDTQLPPSNPDVPPWDSLTEAEQRVAARLQEAYAAFLEHTDAALGQLFDHLVRVGCDDDTMIIITSDNGAAMEGGRLGAYSRIHFFNDLQPELDEVIANLHLVGGAEADSHYATGWAQASNTPGRWYKYHTHSGGIRDPLIVTWPDHVARPGAVLDQFHHIIDLAPTLYEAAGVEPPRSYRGVDQMPIHGTSMLYTLTEPDAPTTRRRQYFEMFGNRGIWADGWKAVTHHVPGTDFDLAPWELYHLDDDFSETHDLAADEPERLRELQELWWHEAGTYGVLPLDDRSVELFGSPPPPGSPLRRQVFDYYPPISHIEQSVAPPVGTSSHRINVTVTGRRRGVLVCHGNRFSGYVLYLDDGRLHYEYNAAGTHTRASMPLPGDEGGTSTAELGVGLEHERLDDGRARGRLRVGDEHGPWFDYERVLGFLSLSGMDIGHNPLSPVSTNYEPPFAFAGHIDHVRYTMIDPSVTGPAMTDAPPLDD
jgi:arylsulfatase A-like enzyme